MSSELSNFRYHLSIASIYSLLTTQSTVLPHLRAPPSSACFPRHNCKEQVTYYAVNRMVAFTFSLTLSEGMTYILARLRLLLCYSRSKESTEYL